MKYSSPPTPAATLNFPILLSPEEREEALKKLEILPVQVRTTVQELTPVRMGLSYREGGWTAAQLVHHLADIHGVFWLRLKLALTEPHPIGHAFEQNAWAETPEARVGAVDDSLLMLEALHGRAFRLFLTLTEEERLRPFRHPRYQRDFTADQLLSLWVWHGEHHLAQMRMIVQN